jgi:hypothetical protein
MESHGVIRDDIIDITDTNNDDSSMVSSFGI